MKTLIELFETSVQSYADNALLWEKTNSHYAPLSYKDARRCVHQFGAGLMALGLNKGDRAGLLSEGRNHWLLGELGILYCGAINVPLSVKLEISELKFRMEHSGARVLVVSSGQAAKIAPFIDELPMLEHVIHLDPVEKPGPKDVTFEAIRSKGETFLESESNRARFDRIWQSIQPDDLANISYTSGTTADPKGVMLSQRNYAINVRQSHSVLDIHAQHKTLAILPWDHSFAHTACLYTFMMKGASVGAVQMGRTTMETLRNIPANIRELKPDILMSVPALSKNFRKSIEKNIQAKGAFTERLFTLGLKLAYLHDGDGWNRGKGWRMILKPGCLFSTNYYFRKFVPVLEANSCSSSAGAPFSIWNFSVFSAPSAFRFIRATASPKPHRSSHPTRPMQSDSAPPAKWSHSSMCKSATNRAVLCPVVKKAKSGSRVKTS